MEKLDYSNLVKTVCASCEDDFSNNTNRYNTHGNYCNKCLARINENIKGHSQVVVGFRDQFKKAMKTKKL